MSHDALPTGQVSPLIHTKVHVPQSRNLLSRPRLLSFLHENIYRKLVLVCAGAGYGKTSLLIDFAASTDLPLCWYTLDSTDRDPYRFLSYLVESVRARFPGFGEHTQALLDQGKASDLHGVIGALVNELVEDIPEYVVIVLDDYQTVEAEQSIGETLNTLVRYLPENAHLVVLSRSVPSLPIIRLAAQGEVAGISADALRFTDEEIQEVLRRNFGLHPSTEELRRLSEDSEGWITGILLGVQALWQGTMGSLVHEREPYARIHSYLTHEVIAQLDPDTREFLTRVCVLPEMDAPLCDALLEREGSAELLEMIERRNLFVVSLEGGWYRFHALFRESLLQEARKDREGFVRLNARAAQLWQERGEPAQAVEHFLQAQLYSEAAVAIDRLVQGLFTGGQLQTLTRWVEALPETVRQGQPRLLRFLAKAYSLRGDLGQAVSLSAVVERISGPDRNRLEWVQSRADRASFERVRGNYREALHLAEETLPYAQELDALATIDLRRTLGVCQHALGDLPTAEVHFRAAVEYSRSAGSLYDQALAYQDLGVCLQAQGHLQEADDVHQKTLELWRRLENAARIANILNNMAMDPFLRGDFQKAYDLLRQALEAARASLSSPLQALVLASLGDVYSDTGARQVARQAYTEGLGHAFQAHSTELIAYLQEALGNLARREGAFREARERLREALHTAASSPSARARVQVSLAWLEIAEGKGEVALGLLAEAAQIQVKAGERLQLPRLWLASSVAQHRLRQMEAARASLWRAAELAAEMGLREPFMAEAEVLRSLPQEFYRHSRKDGLRVLRQQIESPPVLRTESVGQEPQPASLQIRALGPGRVIRGDTEIMAQDWGSRRARELFFYVALHSPASRDVIGAELWPEVDKARMRSNFHATLYLARRIVGVPFAVFQDDVYRWNPAVPYWCDAVEFERILDQAERLPPEDPQGKVLLEQGLALYGGDLLADMENGWCAPWRERLRERCVRALLRLGDVYARSQEHARALEQYERALQIDSFREEAYRGLMRCHALTGERARAIQDYQRCRRHLARELNVEPSAATQSLYQAIVRGTALPPRQDEAWESTTRLPH